MFERGMKKGNKGGGGRGGDTPWVSF